MPISYEAPLVIKGGQVQQLPAADGIIIPALTLGSGSGILHAVSGVTTPSNIVDADVDDNASIKLTKLNSLKRFVEVMS